MKRNIALFDWDGTVSEGFTLSLLVESLIKENVIDKSIGMGLLEFAKAYKMGSISYETMADEALRYYAKSMKGIEYKKIKKVVEKNSEKYAKYIYSHAAPIFNKLKSNNVVPIVISGGPIEILEQLTQKYNIHEVYGFELEVENGVCTGNIKSNPGTFVEKTKIVNKIKQESNNNIVLACGDSTADVALLEAAENCIVVNNSHLVKNFVAKKYNVLNICTNDYKDYELVDFIKCVGK